jgi:thymidine phosphorylase
LPGAPVVRTVTAPSAGYVESIAATQIGEAALSLGAGRVRKEDTIDHSVGIVCRAKRGDRVADGDPLAEVHAATEDAADRAVSDVLAAYKVGTTEPESRPIVLDVIA